MHCSVGHRLCPNAAACMTTKKKVNSYLTTTWLRHMPSLVCIILLVLHTNLRDLSSSLRPPCLLLLPRAASPRGCRTISGELLRRFLRGSPPVAAGGVLRCEVLLVLEEEWEWLAQRTPGGPQVSSASPLARRTGRR